MKKNILLFLMLAGLMACENDKTDFEDFDYTSCYFPYQFPVRTLVLGDDIYDNTNDNNFKFLISATFGGVYHNTKDRVVSIALEESLCKNVRFGISSNDTIRIMPSTYYTLSSASEIRIPSGKYSGNIEVQLKESFFNDPRSIGLNYVIPVKITGAAGIDSVLSGKPVKTSPDLRIAGDWAILPKNFTMFAVKFVNPYHGNYLHRGVTVTSEISGSNVISTQVQHQRYVEDDEVWKLLTSGRNQVLYSGTIRSVQLQGNLKMYLNFNNDGKCTITDAGSSFPVSGTGEFIKEGDSWGNKKRNVIRLTYTAKNDKYSITARDTLVVRDRAITMQTYNPVVFSK